MHEGGRMRVADRRTPNCTINKKKTKTADGSTDALHPRHGVAACIVKIFSYTLWSAGTVSTNRVPQGAYPFAHQDEANTCYDTIITGPSRVINYFEVCDLHPVPAWSLRARDSAAILPSVCGYLNRK